MNITGFSVTGATSYGKAGIYLNGMQHCNITNNNASGNYNGIYLDSSSSNTIYNNYFSNTNNARDNGNNIWNTTPAAGTNIIGGQNLGDNYWSDYAGVDNDGDGLGETLRPYNSSGNITNAGDWHPLVQVHVDSDDIAIFRSGTWYVDYDGNQGWDYSFLFGLVSSDIPLVGDINQDGRDDTAIFRSGTWYVDTTGDHVWDDSFQFGTVPGDVPVVGNIYEFAIEVNKTVWDPKTEDWVEDIKATVNVEVRFKIHIHNSGTCNVTNIAVNDTLSTSLTYAAGNATVNGVPCDPEEISGQCLKWYYNASKDCTSPFLNLPSGENITLSSMPLKT